MKPAKPNTVAEAMTTSASADCPMSRSASSTSTASCAASTWRATSSSPRSRRASASATWCFGWDSNDQLYDNVTHCRLAHRLSDAAVRVLPETCALIPFEDDMPFFLGEFAGDAEAVCPRGTLRRVLDRAADMGFARLGGRRVRVLRVRRDAAFGAREELSRPQAHHAGLLRLFHAAGRRPCRVLSRSPRHRAATMDMEIEGLHTETGPGVLEAAIRVDEALRRRQGGAVQDLHQDPGPAARLDGDLHGQMVARLAGPVRPPPHVAAEREDRQGRLPRRREAAWHVRRDALVRRRPAGADARAAGDGRLHGQLLYAAHPGLLGADRREPGASRTAPARCASSRARRSRSASSTGSPPPTSIPTSRSRRPSARASGASRTGSSRTRRSTATSYDRQASRGTRQLPRTPGRRPSA